MLSGLVVAFAMIPEAIAFSGIAGVDPKVGLFGAFCLSLTIAVVGGRTAMITSATGSTALLMTGLVATGEVRGAGLGVQYLMVAGLVTGPAADPLGLPATGVPDAVCAPGSPQRLRQCPGIADLPGTVQTPGVRRRSRWRRCWVTDSSWHADPPCMGNGAGGTRDHLWPTQADKVDSRAGWWPLFC
ncbi:MAG: hypothetical protein CM15mP77_0700 [Synechococcus sp.]|nr:MAG: hypothetical protein CM15mP77_0700 [Synechococcus sp.]